MDYLVVKWLHILSSTLLFGTGIGSAYYMLRACLEARRHGRGRVPAAAMVVGHVVTADFLFTATTIVIQPLTGWYLAHRAGFPLDAPWLVWTYGLYLLAGACWLPVVWIQIRLRDLARQAAASAADLPPPFWRLFAAWVVLGVPAFFALVVVFYLMVAKPPLRAPGLPSLGHPQPAGGTMPKTKPEAQPVSKHQTSRHAPGDIFLERRLTDVHLIQGQPLAVVAVRQAVEKDDEYESVLWTFCLDSGEARQLTRGPGVDDAPRWSPDGRTVAFLSDRAGGEPQIQLIPIDGGEARALTQLACGVQGLAWRPDGRSLLAICPVNVDPDAREEGTGQLDTSVPPRDPNQPEIVWRLPYKADGEGYTLGRRTHVLLVDAQHGAATPLTSGDVDVKEAVWAPDGQRLAYVATRTGRGQEHCTDLWVIAVAANGAEGQPRRMSREQEMVSAPSWSPDGRWIAFAGSMAAGDAQTRLWLCEVASGQVRPLGDESLEVVPGDLQWQPDSGSIAFVRAHRGRQEIAAISVPGGQLRTVAGGDRHVLFVAAGERLAFVAESLEQPAELFCIDWQGGNERQLSHFNDWRQERTPCVAELRQFTVPDGDGGNERIDGWLLLPAQRKGPVPLLVDVHGGPASIVQLEFNTHVYWYLLCSQGWGVLALNPVGSSSYGRAFSERLRARWGELDLPQHIAAVRQLQQEGVADERVAIAGSSYGGYLSAWAIGNCDVFRAAVVCAPVGNLETHFGTSDSGYYADPYSMNGKPEADRDLMFELSPMAHIERACVPTLFLQGKDDERCPKCQAEEMFVKLRTAGDTPTEMVLYPGGSHHVFGQGKPSHRVDILRRIVDWLSRWVDKPLPPKQARSVQAERRQETAAAKRVGSPAGWARPLP